jgi:hypothetical protein
VSSDRAGSSEPYRVVSEDEFFGGSALEWTGAAPREERSIRRALSATLLAGAIGGMGGIFIVNLRGSHTPRSRRAPTGTLADAPRPGGRLTHGLVREAGRHHALATRRRTPREHSLRSGPPWPARAPTPAARSARERTGGHRPALETVAAAAPDRVRTERASLASSTAQTTPGEFGFER